MTTVACTLAAAALEAAAAPAADPLRARSLANLAAGVGEQTLSPRVAAAFAGDTDGHYAARLAVAMHARTQDDFYPPGRVHVGTIVLPAALAVSTGELLPALAAGYQVMCVVSGAYAPLAQARGLRPSGVFGPVAAAAAAAVALGAGEAELAAAMALAAAVCGGTNQAWTDGSDEWLVQVGVATRAGVEAAHMAMAGVRAAARGFEGDHGWARALFDDPDASRLRLALQAPPVRPSAVAGKPFPVSGIAQVPTYLAAQARPSIAASGPCRVEVAMCPAELAYPGSANRGPFLSRSDSLMSVARCVAAALTNGHVPFATLGEPPTAQEQAWLDHVDVVPEDACAETESELRFDRDGDTMTVRATGREILYPTWQETVDQLDLLASRSEAPPDRVRAFAAALAGGVSGGRLKELLS